jgi:hypothetical protein
VKSLVVKRNKGRSYLWAYHGTVFGKVIMCYLGPLKARSRVEVDLITLALNSLEQYAANAAERVGEDRTAYLQLAAERLSAVGEEALLLAERLLALAAEEPSTARSRSRGPNRASAPSSSLSQWF